MTPRSFREKLADPKDLPRVQPLAGGMKRRYGPGTIVLPAPGEVDELMRKVPRGKVTTINLIRASLAKRHGATVACPIVTGIHARIAAGAAGAGQRRRLESEGLEVVRRGERLFVRNHEKFMAKLP